MSKFRIFLSILILVGLVFIGYSRFYSVDENCPITSVRINDDAVPNDEGAIEITSKNSTVRCFDTPAESLRDLTDGEVDLPDDASLEEVDAAYDAYYEAMIRDDNR